jgi:glutamate-1-semialdehyde 2,1-aminomutase
MNAIRWILSPFRFFWLVPERLLLSVAKHRSLAGHPRIALRLSRLLPGYQIHESRFFSCDGAPDEIAEQRRRGFQHLVKHSELRAPKTLAASYAIETSISDLAFVNRYRIPFPFVEYVAKHLGQGAFVSESQGVKVSDLDGNWSYDISGSYGVNLFGTDFYKECIEQATRDARALGLVLGSYHPIVTDNVNRLLGISGMEEISFHMSGTEAVMQAVRLARYHTKRRRAVRFTGAYHGWWDGVQAGPGNPIPAHDLFTLEEMSEKTLVVLKTRDDIACVLVNPIQCMSPNQSPATDGTLIVQSQQSNTDRIAYKKWLSKLREVCDQRRIVLIFDEVFLGFRLARGGAQEYFGVKADLVTYGKTLGGGLPVGVLCGKHKLMKRYDSQHPANICFARGTFNSHPYVMTAMNRFLRHLDTDSASETWNHIDARWDGRAARLNARLEEAGLPIRVANLTSVFNTVFTQPGRYHWMFQYYLREAGLSLSWIGASRLVFSHDYDDDQFDEVARRFVSAGIKMQSDGWFWLAPGTKVQDLKRMIRNELFEAMLSRLPWAEKPASLDSNRVMPPSTQAGSL